MVAAYWPITLGPAMSNNQKLKLLCQRLTEQQFCSIHDAELALEKFEKLTVNTPLLKRA